MEITVFTSWDQVIPYKEIWNRILEDIKSDIVFLTFEWLYIWWEYHGPDNELFILMVTEGDDILVFCPLMKVPTRGYKEIRFIGGDEASYMNFIAREEYKEKFIAGVLDFLMKRDDNFLFYIHGISKESSDYKILKRYLMEKEYNFLETNLESYYIDIDGQEFDNYFKKNFGRGSIKTMERKLRRLKRLGDVSFKSIKDKQEDIDLVFDIHDKRWERKIGPSKFSKGKTRDFFKYLALSKNLPFNTTIETLRINNRIISFQYSFEYNGKCIFYRIGHDDDFAIFSPGEMVIRERIKECFKRNLRIFDFGLGFEPYKAAWTETKTDVGSFLFPSDNRFSKFIYKIRRWKWNTKEYIKAKPRIYQFIKYRLGKIKFLLYMPNTKRALKRGINELLYRIQNILTGIYWNESYNIMCKKLRSLQEDIHGAHKVEEATVDKLDLLLDITYMDSSSILRKFLKGDRCILVNVGQGILCLWLDPLRISIKNMGYSQVLKKSSICMYDYYFVGKKVGINQEILYSVLEYLKQQGYKQYYMPVKINNLVLLGLLEDMGFKKFCQIRFKRRFGNLSYKEYWANLEYRS